MVKAIYANFSITAVFELVSTALVCASTYALQLHSLDYCVDVVNRLVTIFWKGRRYTVDVFYLCDVSPFTCSCYRFPLLVVVVVKEDIELSPCLLFGVLTFPIPDVFI